MKFQMSGIKMSLFLMLCASAFSETTLAQCSPYTTATAGITLQCVGGSSTRSSLAYNPTKQLYYSVNAGTVSFPMETFSATGTYLATIAPGMDYRGVWWNPNTNQVEGNAYNSEKVAYQNLNPTTGYPTGSVTNIFSPNAQPDAQSNGKYDDANNEIVYYYNGSIYRYSRSTNALVATKAVSGLPVATSLLNSNSICYTGCTGIEYALYDYSNKRVYFINRASGAFVSSSQLPSTAPAQASFGMSWARGLFWLFNPTDLKWYSYNVLSSSLPLTLLNFTAQAQKGATLLKWATANEDNTSRFVVERSTDAITFSEVATVKSVGNGNNNYQSSAGNLPAGGSKLYYRLKMYDKDGSSTLSKVVVVNLDGKGLSFTLKPNVTSSSTTLIFDNQVPAGATLSVYNLAGIKILSQKISSAVNALQLPIQTLSSGMYLVEVNSTTGSYRQKLVVNE